MKTRFQLVFMFVSSDDMTGFCSKLNMGHALEIAFYACFRHCGCQGCVQLDPDASTGARGRRSLRLRVRQGKVWCWVGQQKELDGASESGLLLSRRVWKRRYR